LKHKIYWTPEKIASRLNLIHSLQYRQHHPLSPFRYTPLPGPDTAPPIGADIDDSNWEIIEPNTYWGKWMTNFVMRTEFEVPANWDNNAPIALHLPMGESGDFSHPEALAYIDGIPYASADRHHHEILLPSNLHDGQQHRLALHGWTGRGGDIEDTMALLDTQLFMRECSVVQIHPPTREFVRLAQIALDCADLLSDTDPAKGHIYNALDSAFKILDTREPLAEDFYVSVPQALTALTEMLESAGTAMDVDIVGVGHAHIDVAWLWTIGQVRHKVSRTFSNVLRLMEQYPDYHFTQSQPQLYQYIQQDYPEIFEEIKKRVAEGRWEIIGGAWVEPDCNAIGAESLVRQLLLGRTYFRKHFGDKETPVLWLPDTFGYSWALPQLVKESGMEYFITHKMSWNQYNHMPFQLFWWQGIDGTQVLTHFLTTPGDSDFIPYATTYNSVVSAKEVMGTWNNFYQKETHNELIMAFGHGDGGGGPTTGMLDNIKNLSNMAGAPRVRSGTVREFIERAEEEVGDDLPIWNGEFYLELHRGTLTSQARTKWNNRKSEFLLHDAEFIATLANLIAEYPYPHDTFNQAWELICLNQFHDILPGSSITEVYEDSTQDYNQIRQLAEKAQDEALTAIAQTLAENSRVLIVNPTSFDGSRVGFLPDSIEDGLVDESNQLGVATQIVDGGTLLNLSNIMPYSFTSLSTGNGVTNTDELSIQETNGKFIVENALIRVAFASNGDITSMYDKEAEREVLAKGEVGNALLAMEDRPMNYDAWDIDIYYEDRVGKIDGIETIKIIEQGPIRAALLIKRSYRKSTIIQKIYLYHNSKRIDFDTEIDWHEQHTLLKVAFPVDILSPTATYDIQWGNVERSTHRNTSWDWARFETAAQKWADLSEGNYGVALINDSKYGYDILHNVMRLSLLRSPTMPDPIADQGKHIMTYALLPHIGDWRNSVSEHAYDVNDPLILRAVSNASGDMKDYSLVSVSESNVIIETVKQAEDGNGIIVRLYENERSRSVVTLRAGFNIKEAYNCNLLEENQDPLNIEDNYIKVAMRPYQIMTLRLVAARAE
jgi:alpha-mannosidase